jgi:DNA-binding MarR family transcriptional regulator
VTASGDVMATIASLHDPFYPIDISAGSSMPSHHHGADAEPGSRPLALGGQTGDAARNPSGAARRGRLQGDLHEDQTVAAAPPKPRASDRPTRRALTLADYRALGAFRYAVRRFLAFSESGAVAQAITPQQHQALLAIKAHEGEEPISVSELATSLLIKTHSAVGLVARLVDRGMVEREPSKRDRRRILLRLTRTGERVLETISRKNLGQLKTTMPVFLDLLNALEQLDLPPPPDGAGPSDGGAG